MEAVADMSRPAFQFYTGDFLKNANLRRCTWGERGIWVYTLCFLHDSEEYGILRWPLDELANALGCKVAELQALRAKGVLKGADAGEKFPGFQVRPRHAGREGEPVELIPAQDGPLWFSSRMVWDEHKRKNSGGATRFGATPSPEPSPAPSPSPSQRHGDDQGSGQGHGASSSSSSSSSPSSLRSEGKRARKTRAAPTPLPEGFGLSDRVKAWAREHGYANLEAHLEHFLLDVKANGRVYADWDAALMKAISKDYAELRKPKPTGAPGNVTQMWRAGAEPDEVLNRAARELQIPPWDRQGGETFGQFRQRIVDAGGEHLLKPRAA